MPNFLQNIKSNFKESAHYSWAVAVMWGQDYKRHHPLIDLSSLNWAEKFHFHFPQDVNRILMMSSVYPKAISHTDICLDPTDNPKDGSR